MNREIIARSPSGHIVTEDALLVQRARRAIRQRRDRECDVRRAA